MKESVLRTALLLKSANIETDLGVYGQYANGCTIDPDCPNDAVFIKKAEELLTLDVDLL